MIDGELGEVHDDLRCGHTSCEVLEDVDDGDWGVEIHGGAPYTRTRPPGRYVVRWRSPDLHAGVMEFTRISTSPDKMGGVPCIRDLRFPVATVVAMVADGMTNGFQTLPSDGSRPPTSGALVEAYRAGATISQLALKFGIHRTAVTGHLDSHGVPRHSEQTTWDDDILKQAAELHATGSSLADVADQFGIDAQTVANRFRRAGVTVRPRRGWTSHLHPEQERR